MFHILHGDAEFVLGQAGGDVGMGMCPDVGIDAEADTSNTILKGCQFIDDLQFGDTLYIEAPDTGLQG